MGYLLMPLVLVLIGRFLYKERLSIIKVFAVLWARVNGRNAISWPEKFRLDVWYVENRSLLLDIKILFLTVKKVLDRSGINSEGEATAAKFTGNDDA